MTDGKDEKNQEPETWRTWNMESEPMPKDFPREMALKILKHDLKRIEQRKAKKTKRTV